MELMVQTCLAERAAGQGEPSIGQHTLNRPLCHVAIGCTFVVLVACGGQSGPELSSARERITVNEVSGVAVDDGYICVVDDSIPDTYFRIPIPAGPPPVIPLNDFPIEAVHLEFGNWVDLESIGKLADGRMVVLSERLRGIVSAEGPVAEYDYPLTEYGRRGLEGLAVRPLPHGASQVAVLWEGGYPDYGSVHPQLDDAMGTRPLRPVVFVHDIPPGANLGRVRWDDGLAHALLEVPVPDGIEPEAQRFRAPDLTWYRWPHGEDQREWGFIVLLSSQNRVEKPNYEYHWLQRFAMDGRQIGSPLDIHKLAPSSIAAANWEGVCWFEEGTSVILVHEGRASTPPHALIVTLPAEWQYTP